MRGISDKLFTTFSFLVVSLSIASGHFVLPPAPYITDLKGGPCHDNQTCQDRDSLAFCQTSDSVCHCTKGYISSSDRTRCLAADIRLGGSCEENQQCSFWETSVAVCLPGSGICDCIPGYIPSDDLTQCLPVVNLLGTQTCDEDGQCQLGKPGALSKCLKKSSSSSDDSKVCKCPDGAVNTAKDDKCYPVANRPGDLCEIQAQCTAKLKHSRCMGKTCRCNGGYSFQGTAGNKSCQASSDMVVYNL